VNRTIGPGRSISFGRKLKIKNISPPPKGVIAFLKRLSVEIALGLNIMVIISAWWASRPLPPALRAPASPAIAHPAPTVQPVKAPAKHVRKKKGSVAGVRG
jgi:hypothetical protein